MPVLFQGWGEGVLQPIEQPGAAVRGGDIEGVFEEGGVPRLDPQRVDGEGLQIQGKKSAVLQVIEIFLIADEVLCPGGEGEDQIPAGRSSANLVDAQFARGVDVVFVPGGEAALVPAVHVDPQIGRMDGGGERAVVWGEGGAAAQQERGGHQAGNQAQGGNRLFWQGGPPLLCKPFQKACRGVF